MWYTLFSRLIFFLLFHQAEYDDHETESLLRVVPFSVYSFTLIKSAKFQSFVWKKFDNYTFYANLGV